MTVLILKILDNIVFEISEYYACYEIFIQKFKEDDFNVIGYTCKFPENEGDETRTRILRRMFDKLHVISKVETAFVSQSTKSNSNITKSGANGNNYLLKSFQKFKSLFLLGEVLYDLTLVYDQLL